ncbi:MAG: LysR family transcriptional regulator [Verrucomicrobiales bacterium]|nr:LysR family transcriptional regulator [Verrucomicrobiales bacterium]
MELRHLRYFVAVAEEENVTRAAARLHVSQPPLTRQIRDLESELEVALFERDGTSIRLPAAGRVFLPEARLSLQRVEQAVAAVRAAARGPNGELHLGYAPSPSVEILPKLLRALQQRCPEVRVRLHDHSSPQMLAGLREGRLQAALMMQPRPQAARGISFQPLRSYPVGVLLPPDHAWKSRRTLSLTTVLGEPLVAFARKDFPDYHEFLTRVLGPHAKGLRLAEECDSGPSLMAAVVAGRGVAITPSILALASGKRLRFVPLHPAPAPAVVGLAFPARHPSTIVHSLLQAARP